MHLTLAVDTYQGSAPDAPLACRFGAAGGTIGRGPDNTLVLPDAAKTVSRVHARIDWTEDGWCVADLGSNPSRLNGRPLTGGQPARLADGDRLEVGGYRLGVRTMAREPAEAFDAPLGVHDRVGFDPLDAASPRDDAMTQAFARDPLAQAAVLADAPLPGSSFDPLAAPLGDAHEAPARLDGRAAFAGSESDHVPPEQFAYVPSVRAMARAPAGGIPHDYDPLGDVALAPSESAAKPPMREPVQRGVMPPVASPGAAPRAPARRAAHAGDAVNDASAESAFAALLDGMGVDAGALGGRDAAEVARLAGAMLRTAVRGLVDVLLSRSVLKREISLDTTMLVQRDNNPLKFFPDGDGALAQMLRGASAGYLPAQTALEGALDDIRRHELAVLAGTRAAMQHLLGRFDPQAIARADTRRGWLDWLPACRKARQWDRLVALHAELERASADDLQALCGSAFNDAYERQANGFADAKPLAPSIR
ncbi:type VI secretion system-associated FHA domain protein TagH [Caballeronia ptereochthonis]|uniref:FHA domain-containing protein n=1 Tax=Caballeronia ptereochthonis TaxID=1777144 RepID=A0A157ZX14_9BURK|nr:type VI secretion system-associated FHA domain protein TagH [Caballeronia ptereochthonis]SAK50078.1 FHA domain-containing protein [Caballeronia ptereochthonis]